MEPISFYGFREVRVCGKPRECVSVRRFIRYTASERCACAAGLGNASLFRDLLSGAGVHALGIWDMFVACSLVQSKVWSQLVFVICLSYRKPLDGHIACINGHSITIF
jgi:hypothetical protein